MQINGKAMQQSILNQVERRLGEQSTTQTLKTPLSRALIDLLFFRLEAIYGHLWTSRHSDQMAWNITKDEWGQALADIPSDAIRKSLDELRTNGEQFPPTLPVFVKLCMSKSGLPSEAEAYQMALRREFNHPLAKLCYERIGSWDFTHDSEKELKKKFARTYEQVLREAHNDTKLLT